MASDQPAAECPTSQAVAPKVRLKMERLSLSFGGVKAIADVDIDVYDREILAIIGPNGAGKTSVLNSLSGFYKPQQGEIYFDGKLIRKNGIFVLKELECLNPENLK